MSIALKRWKRLAKCTLAAYMPESVVALLPYEVQRHSVTDWDVAYGQGHWNYLYRSSELARYGTIVSFSHRFTQGGPVLDLGCGEGILKLHLNPDTYARYDGVDLSSEAIGKAQQMPADGKSRFVAADIEVFEPPEPSDVIIFNEVLYYLTDPLKAVQRYEAFLKPGGVFIVSMFDMLKSRKIWRELDGHYALLEASRAVNHGGHSWSIRVYRRRVEQAEPAALPAA
ncbi:class I SAM-dependent methyltransferase [Hydrogenophaga sp. NFH-34]|uniref:class I SAM-dependent methyltransferase n=1 Tax=Hydrogenophaga sp. NFH-34 TaxID=2744446 RepID=UPI001F1B0323|nr:methyltransferase domain-containing protein [Hydrogenophaga sp. NFH-34]